jgi:dipeptidyl-peptidase-4
MGMRTIISLLLCAGLGSLAGAASPAKDAVVDTSYLKDHAETRGFMLGRPFRPRPTPDGKAVLFLRAQPRVAKLRLYEFDVASGKTRELLTPEAVLKGAEEHLTPEEKARRERQRVSVGGFTDFQLSDDGENILVSLSGRLYLVGRRDQKITELKTGSGTLIDPQFLPDGKSVSYVLGNDLYLLDLATQKETRLTSDGTEKRSHGLAEFVAQEEMHRHHGYWWSPDSKSILYQETDTDGVEIWHVADPVHPEQAALPSYYPRPGKANVKVRLGAIPVAGGKTTWLDWDVKNYPYLARVDWPKNGPLTILVQTRTQDEIVLLKVDPETSKTTKLLSESDPAWVNLPSNVPKWLDDGSGFLWISESGKGRKLELRDKSGKLVRILVPQSEGFDALLDLDSKAGSVVYSASSDPTQSQLFRCSLEGGKTEPLSKEPGVHSATFSRDHSLFVHPAALRDAMPVTTVRKADGTVIGELPSVAENPPFTPRTETVTVGDADYSAYIVRPRNFKEKTKYPVIVHVYGGPTHQVVQESMGTRLIDQWIADQGFLVVAIDNRGTPRRGRDWEKSVREKFGSVPLEDQVAGLKALGKKFPEMDLDRVGIYGWSFGGYMAALGVMREPDVFKAGVAGAPVVDWLDYDTHYTERYLGLPETQAAAYKEASLLTYAKNLHRPLLLVHGTADDNVFFRHTLKLSNELFREGRDFDLLPLPGLTHMVPDPVVTQRLYGKFATYFKTHLGEPTGVK